MLFLKSSRKTNIKTILLSSALLVVMSLLLQQLSIQTSYSQNSSTNMTAQSSPSITPESVKGEMQRILESDDPVDIATLAYVWGGFPLITNMRTIDQSTDPQHFPDSEANGPWNEFHYRTKLADANFTQFVTPNVDTLYSNVYYNLEKEPLVIHVPAGIDRYFTIQFIDSYTDNYHYLGTRTTGTDGGTYLLTDV